MIKLWDNLVIDADERQYVVGDLDLISHQKEEIKRLQKEVNLVSIQFQDLQERTKPEAYKEFAERLKEKSFKTIRNYGLTKDVVEVCDIDNLVKEMVGEKE